MTPPATAAAATAHRDAPPSRRRAAPRPRRISGPASSARAATAAAVASPAPGVALPRRRPQHPVAPQRRPARKTARSNEARGIALRAIDAVEGISSSSLLDRLTRGRLWIGLLAFALIGIVAMQLLVLELNTGIGRKLTRVAQLQRANAQLGIEDSGASAEARIDPLATAYGMTFAPSGSLHFVAASPADVARAATALSTAVKAPATGPTESSAEGGEASPGQEADGETTSSSNASASPTAESASGETSSGASSGQEAPSTVTGQSASSATSGEASAGSQAGGAASAPTGAAASAPGGGVQAGSRE